MFEFEIIRYPSIIMTNMWRWMKEQYAILASKKESAEPKDKFLFVPFSDRESSGELMVMAMDWRYNLPPDKIRPSLALYQDEEENLNKMTKNATVYILGHASELPGVIYEETIKPSILSIQQVAQRFDEEAIDDFKGKIKLYFCGYGEQVARKRALLFCEELKARRQVDHIKVEYYCKNITNPTDEDGKRYAGDEFTEEGKILFKLIGKPKDFRKTIRL